MGDQSCRTGTSPASDSRPPGKSPWWWLRLATVLSILTGIVCLTGPHRLWETLRGVQWFWVAAAMPIAFAAIAADALKLGILMVPHGYRGGWGSIFRTCLVVNFASLFLPGTVGGGAIAWYRLSREDGLRAQAFAALSVNTLLKIAATCSTALVALTFDAAMGTGPRGLILWLAIIGMSPLLLLGVFLRTGHRMSLARAYQRLGDWKWMPRRAYSAIGNILQAFESYKTMPGTVCWALVLTFARKLIENVCFLMAIWAVGADASFLRVLWVMCLVEVAGMIPLTLGGFGATQVTYYALFVSLGMSESCALASNIISWVAFLPVYLAGAGVLLVETLHRR